MNRLVVVRYKNGYLSAYQEDGRILELIFEPVSKQLRVGDIYTARILKADSRQGAAFAELTPGVNAYLETEQDNQMRAGKEELVQVVREAIKSKLPMVSRSIVLPGRFLVLLSDKKGLSFSRKLCDEEITAPLKELLVPYTGEVGYIVRTNAVKASAKELTDEAEELARRYRLVLAAGKTSPLHTRLYAEKPAYLLAFMDLKGSDAELVTDDETVFGEVEAFRNEASKSAMPSLRLYRDRTLPLIKLYSLETVAEAAEERRVWLKCGGYLVIEPTEAFVAVDVNSGKNELGKDREDAFFRVNLEAADALMYELRLRNLSGMILADFINMSSEEHRAALLERLRELAADDPQKPEIYGYTQLGLVEMTRRKGRKSLREQLAEI